MREFSTRHPAYGFAAVGKNARFITEHSPFHYPFGTGGPLARLHQLNGCILLAGADQSANYAIHLAENWADMPYARRKETVLLETGVLVEMEGAPGCRVAFPKVESVLRHARLLRTREISGVDVHFMRVQPLVSMIIAIVQGDKEFLLCDNPACIGCVTARRFAKDQVG
jgi:aminoglycoside N3'-acetyltransferase